MTSNTPQLEQPEPTSPHLPSLRELGSDLRRIKNWQRLLSLTLPFLCMIGYGVCAGLGWWIPAVAFIMVLSFVTYGSTSHDLVHRTLGLPRRWNDDLLTLIELLSLRSGTAYRLSHLKHHKSLLAPDDPEGTSAYGSLLASVLAGPTFQARLWFWAWRNHPEKRLALALEACGALGLALLAALLLPLSIVAAVYVMLVVAGSWSIPLITVYLPHDGSAHEPLAQTRLFRGWFVRLVAFDHLYHLEHHLYPAVPHHKWRALAVRLDPYFEQMGVRPVGSKQP